jgi:AAA domain, putative AbiEii toxin, Type IV TA system/AAA domain
VRIRELTLRNVKILADQTFSFVRADGSIRTWTVLLGDNGACKTTILQAIALASSGDKLARVLVQDAADYVRQDRPERGAEILATFETHRAPLHVQMAVKEGNHAFRGNDDASRLDDVRDAREPGFFVVAYGTSRRLPRRGEVAIPQDPVVDRVEGLFDPSHKMLGVDFFEALKERQLGPTYARTLRDALLEQDANGDPLLPWLVNLELRGAYGVDTMERLLDSRRLIFDVGGGRPLRLPPHLLSQGYQSTFAWVADLLGHAFLDAGGEIDPKTLEGIVLLDEIDLHLHPTWQRRIVPILQGIFPLLQFVVTTHSPLVLTGFEADEIIGLRLEGGEIVQRSYAEQPGLQSGSELMEGFFGVPTAGRPELLVKEREALELSVQEQRSPEEEQRLATLRRELAPYLEATSFAAEQADGACSRARSARHTQAAPCQVLRASHRSSDQAPSQGQDSR